MNSAYFSFNYVACGGVCRHAVDFGLRQEIIVLGGRILAIFLDISVMMALKRSILVNIHKYQGQRV